MLEWIQTYLPNVYKIGWAGDNGWLAAINATLFMTVVSFIIGGLLGLLAGLFLVLTGPGGVIENRPVFQIFGFSCHSLHYFISDFSSGDLFHCENQFGRHGSLGTFVSGDLSIFC